MSKIGKISISIPEKVKVALAGSNINIEGPLGKKSLNIDLETFDLDIKEGKEVSIKPKKIDQNTKRLWGMNRSLLNNAIIGASKGYEKTLELVGVGYRALYPTPTSSKVFSYPLLAPIIALFNRLRFIPHNLFVFWSIFFGLIETSFPSLMSRSKVSKSMLSDFLPKGPSIFMLLPASATFTFSGIDILIFPILDIKIPYKLFHRQLFVFLHLYQS